MPVDNKLAIRPRPFTLYLRRSLLWQLWRFLVINLRMTIMILKSHDTRVAAGRRRAGAGAPSVVPAPVVPAPK